jgi:AcrR family transcriptional regulator
MQCSKARADRSSARAVAVLRVFELDVMLTNMNNAEQTSKPRYRSALRQAQAEMTRQRIQRAAASLLENDGDAEGITYKRVAALAEVTEMTVYRHFPTREDLLRGLWEHLNAQMDDRIGLPDSLERLQGQHRVLFEGFDRIPAQILASLTTAQGREMRAAINPQRQAAFLAIARAAAPRADAAAQRRMAGLIQLLHSAYAWLSLREQWDMDGGEAAEATRWAIDTLVAAAAESAPGPRSRTRRSSHASTRNRQDTSS